MAEVRNILKKRDAALGEPGSVAWVFEQKGVITIPRNSADEEALFLAAVDAGAEDVILDDEDYYEVRTLPESFQRVVEAINALDLPHERAELTMVPTTTMRVPDDQAAKLLALLEELDDHDDVQKVYANFEVSDEFLEAMN